MGCMASREVVSSSPVTANKKRINNYLPHSNTRTTTSRWESNEFVMGKWLGSDQSTEPSQASPRSGYPEGPRQSEKEHCDTFIRQESNSIDPQVVTISQDGLQIRYAAYSVAGHYPNQEERKTQDDYIVYENLDGQNKDHFFGVFDGHGRSGGDCAKYVQENIVKCFLQFYCPNMDQRRALRQAHLKVDNDLHTNPEIDDSMSGTTAISIFLSGRQIVTSNVGDSRAVLGQRSWSGQVEAVDLSFDQTPMREEEARRVERSGGMIQTLDQMSGRKDPTRRIWEKPGYDLADPPRVWRRGQNFPGTAFTRSIGDMAAKRVGVIPEPEFLVKNLDPSCEFFIIASDGVFEFISSQGAVDIVGMYDNPGIASKELALRSFLSWKDNEERTDDITCIVGYLDWVST